MVIHKTFWRWLSDAVTLLFQKIICFLPWLLRKDTLIWLVLICVAIGFLPPVRHFFAKPSVKIFRRKSGVTFLIMIVCVGLWFGCIERIWAVFKHKQYLLEHGGLRPVLEMEVGRNLKEDGIQVGVIYADRPDVREWYQFIIKDNYFSPRFTEHLE